MGVITKTQLRFRNANEREKIFCPLPRLGAAEPPVSTNRFHELRADRLHRIKRGHWILKYHRDPPAARAAKLALRKPHKLTSFKDDAARDAGRCRRQQTKQRQGCNGFPAARFPYNRKRLTFGHRERQTIHRGHTAGETDHQIMNPQNFRLIRVQIRVPLG